MALAWPWLWHWFWPATPGPVPGAPPVEPRVVPESEPQPEPARPPVIDAARIAHVTPCPPDNVHRYWPVLVEHLWLAGILTPNTAIAVAATVAIETAHRFAPVREKYNGPSRAEYFEAQYGYRTHVGKVLGNVRPGDGGRFYGRGFFQLTGRDNYERFGRLVGVSLVEDPDRALEPELSARITALFCQERGVARAADAGDWREVRRRVNGGYNNWQEFSLYVRRLVLAP